MAIIPGPLLDRYQNETFKAVPLVYYRMKEGSGTTLVDWDASPINGTYSGTGINWVGSASGQSGKGGPIWNSDVALLNTINPPVNTVITRPFFDGVAGQATATLTGINTGAASKVTVEMWVKWQANISGANGTYQAFANFAGATGILLGILKNGASDYRLGISVRNAGDLWGLSNAATLAALPKDMWNHIVYVITNNAVQSSKLYVNGVQQTMTQQIGTTTTTDSVTTAFAIAYDGTASFFNGGISEVAVYNGEPLDATGVLNKFHVGAYGGSYHEQMLPPGLESQIDFGVTNQYSNPIVLNRKDPNGLRVLDSYHITDIGGLDDADIRFAEEPKSALDGMNYLKTRYGGRTITLDGFIDASNLQSLRQLQARLKQQLGGAGALTGSNSIVSGLVEQNLVFRSPFDNSWDSFIAVRKSGPLQMKENQPDQRMRRPFLATLRAANPFFQTMGSRTEVLQMGGTTYIPNKGNSLSLPLVVFWGPFYRAELLLGGSLVISATVSASTQFTIDSLNRTASNWQSVTPASDMPYITGFGNLDTLVGIASFLSISGGVAGQTRVEITWRHTSI